MHVKAFPDACAFLTEILPILLANEAENSLMIGVAERVRGGFRYSEEPPFFLAVEDEADVLLLATCTPPYPLLLVATDEYTGDATAELARHLLSIGHHPSAAQGITDIVEAFANTWAQEASVSCAVAMHQRLYRMTAVAPSSEIPGAFRWAESDDVPTLVPWIEAFVEEALPAEPPPNAGPILRRHVEATERSLAVWTDRGEPVSMAAATRPTPSGVSIGLVYTPPPFRGRGYASGCVGELSRRLLASGKRFCTLFTDLSNPTSNRLYQRIGYHPVADFKQISFDPS